MKTCTRCKKDLSLDLFYQDLSKKDGKSSRCISCLKESHKDYYERHKTQLNQYAAQSYHKRKNKISLRRKELRANNPEKYKLEAKRNYCPRKSKLQGWKYAGIIGMTHELYDQLLQQQDYACAICKQHQSTFKKALGVDHNHDTGKPRGLLCDNCNRALGYLQESESIINNLLKYLQCYK